MILKKPCLMITAAVLLCGCSGEEPVVRTLDTDTAQPEYLSLFTFSSPTETNVSKYWNEHFVETYNREVYIDFDGAEYYDDEGLSYRELLVRRLESNAPDDLYIINAEDVLEFEKRNFWLDLSDMDFVDNLSDAALYQSTYNNKVFSVPLSFTGFGFTWNVTMLKENGLSIPQNLTEFLNVCETLKNAGILPYASNKGYGLTVPAMCTGLSALYSSPDQSEMIEKLNSGEKPISDYLRDGFEFLSMMIENEYMDPAQALDAVPQQGDLEMFKAGKCGFIAMHIGTLIELSDSDFEYELTGVPVLENSSVAVYGANSRLCVNPNSAHLETALQFIEMVGTTEALQESAALEHTMSSAKDSVDDIPHGMSMVALLKSPNQIPNQDFSLYFNTWESIRDVSRELCGGATIDEACDLLDVKQQEDLKAYHE